MAEKYAAFLSYAHRDQAWVEVLQSNLERGPEQIQLMNSFQYIGLARDACEP